ncbi:MAG: long-chain fatty acid--CoA ligase [Betaproteobacteria bacterium]|nr:long-chain fatty acid--CoA ligase [Betaproteobacteria bacterium]
MGDYIKPDEAVTLHGLFLERVKRTPDAVAYRYFDTHQEAWLSLTWGQMREQVARWQAALLREHLPVGDRVAVMLRNCPQWVMFEQAAMSLGLVVVPLYTVDRPDSLAYIINNAQVKMLLFETGEQWQSLRTVIGQLDCVQRLVSLEKITQNGDPRLRCADEWLPAQAEMGWERVRDRDALATIMYTSGTTGKPKGVMLSHYNMVYNAYAALETFSSGVSHDDILLSFLPLSHTFERTVGYYMSMMAGATVAYARSVPLLADDLKIIRPTILISVPRIFERIYGAIHTKLEEGPPLRHRLFTLAVDVGWDRFEYQQGRGAWTPKLLLWPLLKRLVADKVMDRLGGRLRLSISGGAALPPKISRLFIALGLPIVQGYGLTETSPVVSVNRVEDNRPSTIGQPLRGIEVRIGEQNALLVRGPSNMLGYWRNPEATAAMIDKDGWLNTGDTASIGAGGHITITGRLKEIIVMSNGEKVPPADMEVAILRDRLFDQVMVHGEGHPYLVVLTVVNPEQWQNFAREVGVRPDMPESLRDTRVEQQALRRVIAQIGEFPGYAKVRRVLLLTEPWSIENGLLTPTLKFKRAKVFARYEKEIAQLYEGH